ncbi:hypothetical protein [Micromonospora sonneratiae]|uniref:CHAP domain-containing protein n=1 Tax=Micromonospora sonneratiae TaxID=1184706 RepID=A0ABW3YBQ9_9ACTN
MTTLTATTLIVAGMALPAQAASVNGKVMTADGGSVPVRSGPNDKWTIMERRDSGSTVNILCKTTGSTQTGYYGTTSTWYMIGAGGFMTAARVKAVSTPPNCTYVGDPPRDNPRAVNGAINWAFERLGSTAHEGLCLAFVRQAYGWSSSGWATAEIGGDWIQSHGYMKSGVPPRGAVVWYHNSSGTGHVMISLGEGKVIGTSVSGKVGIANYTYRSGLRGWSKPYFPAAG